MTPDDLLGALAEPLRDWLPGQRWFAGKGRGIDAVRPVRAGLLVDGDPGLLHALVEVRSAESADYYQLCLGLRTELPEHIEPHPIDRVGDRWVYDAVHDPEVLTQLLGLVVDGAHVGGVRFDREPGAELESGLRARLIGAEQSNSSIVFGHHYILKMFRHVTPGPNRDVDLHRALGSVGCVHIAPLLAAMHGELPEGPAVLGMMQRFLSDAAEGWAMAIASVRDLMAEADLHPDEVGGDFAAETARLGAAVASVHADLARALGTTAASGSELRALVDGMHQRLTAVLADVPDLAPHEQALRDAFDAATTDRAPLVEQHVHGDLHLGQALRTATGWILIDFEGEPAVPAAARALPRSPLVDVAGMLRSFDYAAQQYLVQTETSTQLETRAREWTQRNRDAFCAGYAEIADDPRDRPALLRALEMDKAVYEVAYEHHNRPAWLPIPLAAIVRGTTR